MAEGVSFNFVYGQEQQIGTELFAPKRMTNVDGQLTWRMLANKWLFNSGCGANPDPATCVAQYCIHVVGVSIEKAGGKIPSEEKPVILEKVGTSIKRVSDKIIQFDGPGEVYAKSKTGMEGVVLTKGAVYLKSEGVVKVDENGSVKIYLIEGNATYLGFSNATKRVYYYILKRISDSFCFTCLIRFFR